MSLDIQIRETELSPPFTLGLYDLKARIQRGEVGPKVLVCDRVLTNNEWWTLDNLNIFHNCSPTPHPVGEFLRKKHEVVKQRDVAQQRSWQLLDSYLSGNLIDERFGLTLLNDLIVGAGVAGVTRLYVLRSFEPERIFTFLFGQRSIQIEVAQGQTSLWQSLPQVASSNGIWQEVSGPPFESAQIRRATAEIHSQDAPEALKQWRTILAAAELAPDCRPPSIDGVSFKHQLLSPTNSFSSEWLNPREPEQTAQIRLIEAYHDCILTAGLGRFWQGRSCEPLPTAQ